MKGSTAVLIFANSSQKEIHEKNIPSFKLFEKLNDKVLKTVKSSGLDYFLITENDQIGDTFGERFTNAIDTVFEKGFENIITVGNDTPQLSTAHLKKTAQLLEQNKIVLGRSRDGGFYLLGIQKRNFDSQQFLNLPWQTSKLSTYVERLLKRSSADIENLQTLQDIDSKKDLQAILHIFSEIPSEIIKIILQLTSQKTEISTSLIEAITELYRFDFYNKGSPQLHF